MYNKNNKLKYSVFDLNDIKDIKRLNRANKKLNKQLKHYNIELKQLLKFYNECLDKNPDDKNLLKNYNRIKKILDKIENDKK